MSAKHAVLGLVIEHPGYGYQLAQRLDERFGSSGFAPSGVYSALDRLSRDELVRSASKKGAGPARRHDAPTR
jgi:DNA-binding PadR family transcriptional regulator